MRKKMLRTNLQVNVIYKQKYMNIHNIQVFMILPQERKTKGPREQNMKIWKIVYLQWNQHSME